MALMSVAACLFGQGWAAAQPGTGGGSAFQDIRLHGRPPPSAEPADLAAIKVHVPAADAVDQADLAPDDWMADELSSARDRRRGYESLGPASTFVPPPVVSASPQRSGRNSRGSALATGKERNDRQAARSSESAATEPSEAQKVEQEALRDTMGSGWLAENVELLQRQQDKPRQSGRLEGQDRLRSAAERDRMPSIRPGVFSAPSISLSPMRTFGPAEPSASRPPATLRTPQSGLGVDSLRREPLPWVGTPQKPQSSNGWTPPASGVTPPFGYRNKTP